MFAEMPIAMQHITLERELVHVWLFSPVIVADLLQNLPDLTADCEIRTARAQPYLLDRVPEILPQRRVFEETPFLVLSQQAISTNWAHRGGGLACVASSK